MRTEAEMGGVRPQAKEPEDHAAPEAGGPPQSLRREHRPACTWTSEVQPPDGERIHQCCFKPPSLWHFVTAAPGDQRRCTARFQKLSFSQSLWEARGDWREASYVRTAGPATDWASGHPQLGTGSAWR